MDRSVDRIMDAIQRRSAEIAERVIKEIVSAIPAYSALDPETIQLIRQTTRNYIDTAVHLIREQRPPTAAELETFGRSARRRAREGMPLDAILQGLRTGFQVVWDVVREEMRADPELHDFDAVLEIGTALLRHIDVAATHVSRHHRDELERIAASTDRRHHRLIGALLREGVDSAAAAELASSLEVRLAPRYWVVLIMLTPDTRYHASFAQTLRELPFAASVLAAQEGDVVTALWPDEGFEQLERSYRAIVAAHGPLLAAVAGPAAERLDTVAEEARTVRNALLNRDGSGSVEGGGQGLPCGTAGGDRLAGWRDGLFRLPDVLLEALIRRTDGPTTQALRRLVSGLTPDLRDTIEALVEADLSVREAARRLHVHRNSVHYRLGRIKRITGRDPRNVRDLFLLYAGLRSEVS